MIFAVSRPLAGGWLGLTAGGRPDTTIVVLDRSPSMQQVGADARGSKLETGVRQLVATLETLGSARWVLIESNAHEPRELEKIDDLLTTPGATPASASADLPAMLLAALDYVKANKAGRTEIWICSDIRENDWNADSGRWQALRDGFAELTQGVRFHLLAYPQTAAEQPVGAGDRRAPAESRRRGGAFGLARGSIARGAVAMEAMSIPVHFEIDGARSEVTVELAGAAGRAQGPSHPARERARPRLGAGVDSGGREPGGQRLLVRLRAARRRGGRSSSPKIPQAARPLATGGVDLAGPVDQVHRRGGRGRPARCGRLGPGVARSCGRRRCPTREVAQAGAGVCRSRRFGDLLSHARCRAPGELFGVRWTCVGRARRPRRRSRAGAAMKTCWPTPPAASRCRWASLQVRKYCGLSGEVTPLATLRGGAPLLARVTTSRGAAYFCATTPAPGDSSLATSGVVFYVMVQRALAAGAAALGNTRQLTAGDPPADDPTAWKRVAGAREALSTDYRVSPRHLSGRRAAAGGQSRRRAKRRHRCWPIAAWPSSSRASIMPGSTTRPAASAR